MELDTWKNNNLIKRSRYRIVDMGSVVEVLQYENPFYYNFIQKKRLSYKISASHDRRKDNLERTKKSLSRLIIANSGVYFQKPLFITYTFAENIIDLDTANYEFKKYTLRLNYFLKNKGFNSSKYVAVVEFQSRGAVHYHCIYFNIPFIPNLKLELAKLWGLGFLQVKSLDNIKNVANYITKYLKKGLIDNRLRLRKSFFSSRNLFRPVMLRNEIECVSRLAEIRKNDKMCVDFEKVFKTEKFGNVKFISLIKK